jgi:hypothetical protein
MAKNTKTNERPISYLDLDAVVPDNDVVVKFGGKEHKLVPITLEDFVKNTKAVQAMGTSTDPDAEMAVIKDMLQRAFPTITPDMTLKFSLLQLNTLLDFAMKHNGSKKVEEAAEADAANPPMAGE